MKKLEYDSSQNVLRWMECEAGRRIPYNFCLQYESEAKSAKLPLFEGSHLLISSGFGEMTRMALGFYRKAKVWKDLEKSKRKT